MKVAGILLFASFVLLAVGVVAQDGTLSIDYRGTGQDDHNDVRKEMKAMLRAEMDTLRSEMEEKFQEMAQEIRELKLSSSSANGRDMLMTMYKIRQQQKGGKEDISYENGNMTLLMIQLMTELSYGLSAKSLRQYGNEYLKIGGHMHAILLYYVAGLKDSSSGDQGVIMKQYAVQDIRQAVVQIENTSHEFNLAKTYAIPLMEDLLAGLRGKAGASRKTKAEYQTWALKDIGLCHQYFGDNVNAFLYAKLGMETMEAEFDRYVNRYRVYTICLINCGVAKQLSGEYKEALAYYNDAMDALDAITDFPNPELKGSWSQVIKANIAEARALIE